ADVQRKKTMDMVEKNWEDFHRLKTQSMALEITQIDNRRGAMHRERMPKEVAQTTAKNLYMLCSDLQRLTFHLNQKTDLTRLIDETLTLAEAIAPLYGAKEDFVDSRENTSSTNVSISNGSSSGAASETSSASSSGSVPTSSNSKKAGASYRIPCYRTPNFDHSIRANPLGSGKDTVAVSIPPVLKIDPKYSTRKNVYIDGPSLREKSSNYYWDKDVSLIDYGIRLSIGSFQFAAIPQGANDKPPEPVPVIPSGTVPSIDHPFDSPLLPADSTIVPPPSTLPTPTLPLAAPITVPAAATPVVQQPSAAPAAAPTDVPAATAAAPVSAAAAAEAASDVSLSVDSDSLPLTKVKKKKSSSRRSSKERKSE
ncbi:hypothetical protein PMAYCL1PPCAC_28803, partial [Pristionchus mayeri]